MKRLIMLFLFLGFIKNLQMYKSMSYNVKLLPQTQFIKLNFEEWTGFTGQWVKMDRISGWQDLRDCFL